jgi:lysozyme
MATGRLSPDAILEQTAMLGALSTIQDDPDLPNSSWMTTDGLSDSILRVSFPSPTPNLTVGASLQNFRVLARKSASTSSNGTITIALYENGVQRTSQQFTISNTQSVFQLSWNANLLSNLNGSNVEVRIVGVGVYSGKGSDRFGVDFGAVEWNYNYTPLDTTPPANVTNLSSSVTETSATLTWTKPSDSDFAKVKIYRNNSYLAESTGTSYTDNTVVSGTQYTYKVTSVDTNNNESTGSLVVATTAGSPPAIANMTLKPTSISYINNLSPNNVAYLQDSPDSPDTSHLLAGGTTSGTPIVGVKFDLHDLISTQTIRWRVTDNSYIGSHIEVYENGVLKHTSATKYGSAVQSDTWDASILTNGNTANVEIRIVGHVYNSMTIGSIQAIEWVAKVLNDSETPSPSINVDPTVNSNYNTPTELFPFNNSAWKNVVGEAIVSTDDGSQARLIVEYSKDQTFTTGVYRDMSALTNSGEKASITLNQISLVSGDILYWRAWTTNDDTSLASSKTSTFNYTYKPNGFFSSATEFMTQGNPSIHYRMIDVSEYQGTIDWQAIKNDGISHSYLRAYGSSRTTNNGNGDTMFETYIQQANAVGIKTGAYIYAMPSVPLDLAQARAEADLFIAKLEAGYGAGNYGDLMPMIDVEDNSGVAVAGQSWTDLGVEETILWVDEFRNHFETVTGRKLGLYTSDNFVRDLMNNFNHDDATGQAVVGTSGNLLKDMVLWASAFIRFDRYKGYVLPYFGGWTDWQLFQYSDDEYQTGITANYTDQNLMQDVNSILRPSDITGLSVVDDGTNVVMTWNPSTESDVVGYNIYLNGVWHDWVNIGTETYTYTGLSPSQSYEIGVSSSDKYGESSDRVLTSYTIVPEVTGVAPKVTIISVSRTKISDEPEFDKALITFSFDIDTKSYTVNVNGSDHLTGVVAHSGSGKTVANLANMTVGELALQTVQEITVIVAGLEIVAEVDWTELSNGDNRINFYGQATDGTWTPYFTGADVTPPEDVTNLDYMSLSPNSIVLTWTHSTSSDVQDYTIYQDGVEIGQTVDSSYGVSNLLASTSYSFKVVANDGSGNSSTGVTINATTISGEPPVEGETLYVSPSTIVSKSLYVSALSDLQDDPTTYATDETRWEIPLAMEGSAEATLGIDPVSGILTGQQKLQVSFFKDHGYSNSITIKVLENGLEIATETYMPLTNEKGMRELTFDASLLSDKSGAGLQAYITTTANKRSNPFGGFDYWRTDFSAVRFVLQT